METTELALARALHIGEGADWARMKGNRMARIGTKATMSEWRGRYEVRGIVRYNSDLAEYRVQVGYALANSGEGKFPWDTACDYFTNDLQDALGTMALMVRKYACPV